MRERDGGSELTKVACKHIWKCHNPTIQLIYANKNVFKKKMHFLYGIPQ
jgi:hypothetical protein